MKKILLVTLDFPPHIGGVARYYENLCRSLPAAQVVVLASQVRGFRDAVTFPVVRKRLLWRFWPHWLPLFWQIVRVVRQQAVEHIVVGQVLPVGTVVWLLSLVGGRPYSVITHGMDVVLPQQSWRKRFLLRRICARAQFVTAVSVFTRDMLLRAGVSATKTRLLPPGVTGLKPSQRNFRQELDLDMDAFLILTVARLIDRKGHDLVLSALHELSAQGHKNWHYIIVGTGPMQTVLEKTVVSLGLRAQVTFLHHLSDGDMAAAYQACDVFVMPSRAAKGGSDVEGFGIVFLEAALFAKPSITSDSGGVGDAVVHNETGLIVPDGDTMALAAALRLLWEDPQKRQLLGQQAQRRAQRDFLWSTQAKKFVEFL